jgi:hypothetical protein
MSKNTPAVRKIENEEVAKAQTLINSGSCSLPANKYYDDCRLRLSGSFKTDKPESAMLAYYQKIAKTRTPKVRIEAGDTSLIISARIINTMDAKHKASRAGTGHAGKSFFTV